MDGIQHLHDIQREKLSYVSFAEMKFFYVVYFIYILSLAGLLKVNKKARELQSGLVDPSQFFYSDLNLGRRKEETVRSLRKLASQNKPGRMNYYCLSFVFCILIFFIENIASISIEKPKKINKKAVIAPAQLHFPSTPKKRKIESESEVEDSKNPVCESNEDEHEESVEVEELKKNTVGEISEDEHEDTERNQRQEEKIPHDKDSESDEDDSERSQVGSESDYGKPGDQ
jgi:hypothetical protein